MSANDANIVAASDDDDDEFTIRVTGEIPPPFTPTSENQGGAKKKSTSGNVKANVRGGARGGGGDGGGSRRRFDVRLRPSMTFDALRKRVVDEFFEASTTTADPVAGGNSYDVSILVGFPPRALTATAASTLRDLGIRPNESVIARFVPSTTSTSVGGGKNSNDATMAGEARSIGACVQQELCWDQDRRQ